MISVLVALAFGGCHQHAVVKQQVVQKFVAQQVAYVPAVYVQPLVQTYGVVDPYWVPRDNSAERIERLLQAVETQAATIEKLTASQVKECHECQTQPAYSLDSEVHAIFERSCVTCHNAASKGGGIDLTAPISPAKKITIAASVGFGTMPKNADGSLDKMLPDSEIALIEAWADKAATEEQQRVSQLRSK